MKPTFDSFNEFDLSLSQAYTMLGSMQWAVRQSSEAENYLNSVERILEYATLKPEPTKTSDLYLEDTKTTYDRKQVKSEMRGIVSVSNDDQTDFMNREIEAKNYCYRHSDKTAVVLKQLNFKGGSHYVDSRFFWSKIFSRGGGQGAKSYPLRNYNL